MKTLASTHTLPFDLGSPRSFRGLTLVPLCPARSTELEYVGLDEAVARGFIVSEIGAEGVVESLLVENPLSELVLLYEGEELVGAKQNRILDQTILIAAGATLKVPAKCVERGRWARRSQHFAAAPRAAYPELRRAQREGQAAVWADVAAKQERLQAFSPTGAAESMYVSRGAMLEEYVQALPRLDGQSGVLVGIGGRLVCLDYVSRSDVFAGLYLKLLRGYALDAIESRVEKPASDAAIGRFLGELELAGRASRPAVGLGEVRVVDGYAIGSELVADGEVVALSAFPARA
jgi:ARG and Rhodanese-Phosphatase-superfamily-associated Protein domain